MRNNKKGITVTSITIYVVLFFMFTTITTIISSGFNEDLFNDRGTAINITAINKLEYNLLKSADESAESSFKIEDKKTTITFSNLDTYVFDLDKHVIYKNGGKLVDFLSDIKLVPNNGLIEINVTLNKYTNEVSRKIKINTNTDVYTDNGLIAYFDGINNQGENAHSDVAATWKDLSGNGVVANLSDNFTYDGTTNGWIKNGLLFPAISGYNVRGIYNSARYPSMTFEISVTPIDKLGDTGSSYVRPVHVFNQDGSIEQLAIGMRYGVALMYGAGNNTVLAGVDLKFSQDDMKTMTLVQHDLTKRSLYVNGKIIDTESNLALEEIEFARITINGDAKASYIIHGVRVYNRALTEEEIVRNHNIDMLRFGE